MTDLNKTFCSILLSNARQDAKDRGINPKGISTYRHDMGSNSYFEVWAASGIVWQGSADNANHAKANYINELVEAHDKALDAKASAEARVKLSEAGIDLSDDLRTYQDDAELVVYNNSGALWKGEATSPTDAIEQYVAKVLADFPPTPPATITVAGHFGDKQITRDDFIKQWTDHARQFSSLPVSSDDFEDYQSLIVRIEEMAGASWDDTYARSIKEAA